MRNPNAKVIGAGQQTVEILVIDADGSPVADATVVVKSGSARLESIETATTESDGRATISIEPGLGANQDDGTLEIDIKPLAGSEFADKRENTRILVVSDR